MLKDFHNKIDKVVVLDCASLPEFLSIAIKAYASARDMIFLNKVFVNPIGMTSYLTSQLQQIGHPMLLRRYAEVLANILNANCSIKDSSIDWVVHTHGFTDLDNFLSSFPIKDIYNLIHNELVKGKRIMVTSDHGYDIIECNNDLCITHGIKYPCPLNFSKLALFLILW